MEFHQTGSVSESECRHEETRLLQSGGFYRPAEFQLNSQHPPFTALAA